MAIGKKPIVSIKAFEKTNNDKKLSEIENDNTVCANPNS